MGRTREVASRRHRTALARGGLGEARAVAKHHASAAHLLILHSLLGVQVALLLVAQPVGHGGEPRIHVLLVDCRLHSGASRWPRDSTTRHKSATGGGGGQQARRQPRRSATQRGQSHRDSGRLLFDHCCARPISTETTLPPAVQACMFGEKSSLEYYIIFSYLLVGLPRRSSVESSVCVTCTVLDLIYATPRRRSRVLGLERHFLISTYTPVRTRSTLTGPSTLIVLHYSIHS